MWNARVIEFLVCVVFVLSGGAVIAQSELLRVTGSSGFGEFGRSVRGVGDVNGDGCDDFAVGGRSGDFNGNGYVRVFSGADGSIIHHWFGTLGGDAFGDDVGVVEDIDGDGVNDILVGAPCWSNAIIKGYVQVRSGATGFVIFTVPSGLGSQGFGTAVQGIDDVDGDGVPDFAIGDSLADTALGLGTGAVSVHSGADGSMIYAVAGDISGDNFGASVDRIDDIDGDGEADILVGASRGGVNTAGYSVGYAMVLSGATGSTIHCLAPPLPTVSGIWWIYLSFGETVTSAGDFDGDGCPDILVTAPSYPVPQATAPGYAVGSSFIFSGATGSQLHHIPTRWNRDAPWGAATLGDMDGDGKSELAIGNTQAVDGWGYVSIHSGGTGAREYMIHGIPDPNAALQHWSFFGAAVANVGDTNGDGITDFAVGDSREEVVRVFSTKLIPGRAGSKSHDPGCVNGTPPNLAISRPQGGTVATLGLSHGSSVPTSAAMFFTSGSPPPVSVSGCLLHVDITSFASPFTFFPTYPAPGGGYYRVWQTTLVLPSSSIVFSEFTLQAAVYTGYGLIAGWDLSTALEVHIGQ